MSASLTYSPEVPVKFSATPCTVRREAPNLGEHTEEVLREIGLAPPAYHNLKIDDIKQLIRDWQGPGYRPETEPLALSIFDLDDPDNIRARLSRENNMHIAHSLWSFEPGDYLSRACCPVLVVIAVPPGQTVAPEMYAYAEAAEKGLLHGQVVWMPDTIHDIPWHRPEELVAVLAEFL